MNLLPSTKSVLKFESSTYPFMLKLLKQTKKLCYRDNLQPRKGSTTRDRDFYLGKMQSYCVMAIWTLMDLTTSTKTNVWFV